MAEPISIAAGKWLKFDRYELRSGCIAPVRGAKTRTYDPWKLRERPYQALAELVGSHDAPHLPALQPELVEAVIGWCNRYGLLGTLFHRVVAVTLWPRWRRLAFDDRKDREVFVPEQHTHVHVPAGWRTQTIRYSNCISKDSSQLGAPVSKEKMPERARQSMAIMIDLPGFSSPGDPVRVEPLESMWARYFPDVPSGERTVYAYPDPLSQEFWEMYAEPVHEFVQAARLLTNALEVIRNPQRNNPVAAWFGLSQSPRSARNSALYQLSELASCTSPVLERKRDGSLHHRWVAGSLLSSLALRAMEDLAAKRLHRCGTCGHLFLSEAHQVEYCTPKCRHTMQKRRFRSKHPDYERRARHRRVGQEET